MGTETSVEHPNGTAFGMYHADQYMAPEGSYETVTMADNSTWYRQYATDTVERTPYMTGEGKIAYHENLVQKLPNMPKRKDVYKWQKTLEITTAPLQIPSLPW